MSTRKTCWTDSRRLLDRIQQLGSVGATADGGVCRIALTDADRSGRDLVRQWMREIGLEIFVDQIGNILGRYPAGNDSPAVMIGSHIDTVATGGKYDGNLGVLAGLEIAQTLIERKVEMTRPIVVAVFTNEEGVRYSPDMMGSLVFAGGLPLSTALEAIGIDGTRLGTELERIGYRGTLPIGATPIHSYVELHIEQGPVLEAEQTTIGAVDLVQGISWTECTIRGQSNHAGTTPMRLRRDAGWAACNIANFVHQLATDIGGSQVGTVGRIGLTPNLINVIARQAVFTVDLRNTDDAKLAEAERRFEAYAHQVSNSEGMELETRRLVRLPPVSFDGRIVTMVEKAASSLGYSVKRMPSGAGHDAQMLAPRCPAGMIFIPSVGGISHNVREFSKPEHVTAGLSVLELVVAALLTGDAG
ncbi:MAG TPA: Zn-dependent hydrolase [Steroidobacteraceae bacterium]|nr:Zn-dependent hydrolase [Steroidobacteraceae bacterium]